jgi:Xaa-Pro aminopeptidase
MVRLIVIATAGSDDRQQKQEAGPSSPAPPAHAYPPVPRLVRGLPAPREYRPFTQDKTLWYLTGVESPNAALVMDAKSKKEILFLPKADKRDETWNGERWDTGDPWVKDVTGFQDIRPIGDLLATLKEMTAQEKNVWISMEPYVPMSACADQASFYDQNVEKDPLDGRTSREKALKAALKKSRRRRARPRRSSTRCAA